MSGAHSADSRASRGRAHPGANLGALSGTVHGRVSSGSDLIRHVDTVGVVYMVRCVALFRERMLAILKRFNV